MIDKKFLEETIDLLCKGSDRQLDDVVKKKLLEMKGLEPKEIKNDLLFLLDDCVYGSLVSDFVLQVLDILWKQCGGSIEEAQSKEMMIIRNERSR